MAPKKRYYSIASSKLKGDHRLVFFSDLHERRYGEHQSDLLALIQEIQPDLILCAGDICVARSGVVIEDTLRFMKDVTGLAPVYMTNGNHESEMRRFHRKEYDHAMKYLREAGLGILNNDRETISLQEDVIHLYGLELPTEKYKKFRKPHLGESEIRERLGTCNQEGFSILMAHNPQFIPRYLQWNADLTLCGHFHGGVMRLWGNQVLLSPYGFPLPKYGYGQFSDSSGMRHAIVTSGLGDHAIPFRIHNPEEIVVVDLKGASR